MRAPSGSIRRVAGRGLKKVEASRFVTSRPSSHSITGRERLAATIRRGCPIQK